MKTLSDIYQKIVCIPNAIPEAKIEQRKAVLKSVNEVLKGFKHVIVKIEGNIEKTLLEAGRDAYTQPLQDRCRHLFTQAQDLYINNFKEYSDQNHPMFELNADLNNHLRDFYHLLYYSSFYAGRIVLINGLQADEHEHRNIANKIGNFSHNNSSHPWASAGLQAQSLIDQLQKKRNIADYQINYQAINDLALPETITDDFEKTKNLVITCGILL